MKMKWEEAGFKSETARAEGLGSAHHGVKHWIHQRMTAVANLFLVAWFVYGLTGLIRDSAEYGTVTLWLQSGINPVLMILFCLSVFYHAKLGLQIVIEDYVHGEGAKVALLAAMKFAIVGACAICVFSVLKIAL